MERVGRHGGGRPDEEDQPRHVLFSRTRVTRCCYTTFHGGRVFRYTLFSHKRAIRTEEGRYIQKARMLTCDPEDQ